MVRQGQRRVGQGLNSDQDWAGQDSAWQDRTGQRRTGQDRTEQDRAGQQRTGWDSQPCLPPNSIANHSIRKFRRLSFPAQNITLHMTVHTLSGLRTKWVWQSGWRIDEGWYVISVRTGGAYRDWHEEGVVRCEGHCPGGPREVVLEHPGVAGREGSGREEEWVSAG